jgi:hypothetical protein
VGGGQDFIWDWVPAVGHSGGILLGVRMDVVEVGAFDQGEFFACALFKNKSDGFKWEVVVVYGPTQHTRFVAFLGELEQKCQKAEVPLVIGGDFNLIRCRTDKSNDFR